jgi:hypothetical protein
MRLSHPSVPSSQMPIAVGPNIIHLNSAWVGAGADRLHIFARSNGSAET